MLLRTGESCSDCRCHGWMCVLWSLCRDNLICAGSSLLFIVPHLHLNVWVWVWLEVLTLSANHRARWDNKGYRTMNALIAWGTMVRSQGSRWRTGGVMEGDSLSSVWMWESVDPVESRSAAWCWDQWLWLNTHSSSPHTWGELFLHLQLMLNTNNLILDAFICFVLDSF